MPYAEIAQIEVQTYQAALPRRIGGLGRVMVMAAIALSFSTASFGNSDITAKGIGPEKMDNQPAAQNTKPKAATDYIDLAHSAHAFNVLANDMDADHDPLMIVEATAKFGAVAFTSDGLVAYAANPDQARADEITYIASDGRGGFDQGRVVISNR